MLSLGAPVDVADGRWRGVGDHWEHACPGCHQCGHFAAITRGEYEAKAEANRLRATCATLLDLLARGAGEDSAEYAQARALLASDGGGEDVRCAASVSRL